MRRLPIYILVDTSESMRGEPIESVKNGIRMLVTACRKDPMALETAWLSVITFGGVARQIVPLTELCSFEVPKLDISGDRMLGSALELLCECRTKEFAVTTATQKGDWRPYVFIFTDGKPADDISKGLSAFRSMKWASTVSCAAGLAADRELLNEITPECVVDLSKADQATFAAFFIWPDAEMEIVEDDELDEYFDARGDFPPPPAELVSLDESMFKVKGASGEEYIYIGTDNLPEGAMKHIYFAPDKSYVVVYFKERQEANVVERLQYIVEKGRQCIYGGNDSGYWSQLFCWPRDIVWDWKRFGFVLPTFPDKFYFKHDGPTISLKGMEKEGKWFTSAENHFRNIPSEESGDWRSFFNISLQIARAVRKLHEMGFAHADLSYKNVLVDPVSSSIQLIGLDYELVVPGKYQPNAIGTPDFMAPEIYQTLHLRSGDPNRKQPNVETDLHSLAVLIYMYLLYRHPLRGRQICDKDDQQRDELMTMGEKAVFIEDPTNKVNRYDVDWVRDNYPKSKLPYILPWMDLDKLPYTILGPYLKDLLDRAFVQGLHNPSLRPKAEEWEAALVQTMDLMIPCQNPSCKQKWFVFDNSASKPKCPFCGASYDIPLPVLNLYDREGTTYRPTGMRVMVYNGTRLYLWHTNPRIVRNEKLTDEQKKSLACFQFHQGKWYLRNERAKWMTDLQTKQPIPAGSIVELKDGVQIRLDDENSRMIYVQMVNK